jgi:hypothetical protein
MVGILLLIGVAWLLGGRPADVQQVQSVAASAPATRPNGSALPSGSAFAVLRARDLAATLSQFAAQAPAEETRRLRVEIDASCRVLSLLQREDIAASDPRREPALRELRPRCAGLPVPSMYVPVVDTRMPTDDAPDPLAAATALDDLRAAQSAEQLIDAWLVAYRHDALPQHRIFPDQRRLLPAEAEALIRVVVDWRECARLMACGPDSLFALRICAQHGCTAGSDVHSAWHQALSPHDYESAQAIHQWLLDGRRGGGG